MNLEAKLRGVKSRYLRFDLEPYTGEGVGAVVAVLTKKAVRIGIITYYVYWRSFAFSPLRDTVWSEDCLYDVRAVLNLMKRHLAEQG